MQVWAKKLSIPSLLWAGISVMGCSDGLCQSGSVPYRIDIEEVETHSSPPRPSARPGSFRGGASYNSAPMVQGEAQVEAPFSMMEYIKQLSHQQVVDLMYRLLEVDPATALSVPLIPPLFSWSENHISSHFGWRKHPVKGGFRFHYGIDLAGPPQYVRAAGIGSVKKVGYDGGGLGNFVEVDHGNSYTTVYGHLSQILCIPGQWLALDTPIGILGKTGMATGYHLHYTVKKNGVNINPAPYLVLGLKLVDEYKKRNGVQ